MPHEFPPWKTVYHYFRRWRLDGRWEHLHTAIREAIRLNLGRTAQPSAGIIDSQSVKTTSVGGPRGYDGGKKVTGRKRHLLVDTQGFVLAVTVHTADIMDRDGIKLLIEPVKDQLATLKHIWLDAGYNGRDKGKAWLKQTLACSAEIVRNPPGRRLLWDADAQEGVWRKDPAATGFRVLPRRWVVERIFARLSQNRRLSKDYERRCATSEAFIYVAMTRLMARRLAAS